MKERLDCIVIGYNEMPFHEYEGLVRQYGQTSEAYRDLQFSFVEIEGSKYTYVDLLNRAYKSANEGLGPQVPFQSCAIPNLAAVYLTHYLQRKGMNATYINLFQESKDLLAKLLENDPVCVAITTTFYVVNAPLRQMTEFIRACNPRVPIIAGGPLIGNHSRSMGVDALLADAGADIYVIESQGEATLARLVKRLREGGPLEDIPNLGWLVNGRLHRTASEHEENSLDETAIDWRAFEPTELGSTIQTRTARSCAFKCAFCNYPSRAGQLALASLGTIERELDSIQSLGQIKNVVFIDDTFNVPLPRFKDICRLLINKRYGFNWYSYFRCANSDHEAIELMAESGCKGVFLGIESGSPRILKAMNKAATVEKYEEGIAALRRYGILTFASFIVGFPGENADSVAETTAFIQRAKPDYYRAQLWYCEPGTPIYNQRILYGITGEGFVWKHMGMASLEAMGHIERMFLEIDESEWLPQWSFDFWIIPYLIGRGLTPDSFRRFMAAANSLLKAEIAYLPVSKKASFQSEPLRKLVDAAQTWHIQ